MGSNGYAIVIWKEKEQNVNKYNIRSRRYIAGTGWEPDTPLIDVVDGGIGVGTKGPSVAVDLNGNAIASWLQSDGSPYVWANRYQNGVGWGIPVKISDIVNNLNFIKVTMSLNGDVIVKWVNSASLWVNRFDNDSGAWDGQVNLGAINVGSGTANSSRIAMDWNGTALAVWSQGSYPSIIMARRYDGAVWSPAQQIGQVNAAHQIELAMNTNGDAIVMWGGPDDPNTSNINENDLLIRGYNKCDGWDDTPTKLGDQVEWNSTNTPNSKPALTNMVM